MEREQNFVAVQVKNYSSNKITAGNGRWMTQSSYLEKIWKRFIFMSFPTSENFIPNFCGTKTMAFQSKTTKSLCF